MNTKFTALASVLLLLSGMADGMKQNPTIYCGPDNTTNINCFNPDAQALERNKIYTAQLKQYAEEENMPWEYLKGFLFRLGYRLDKNGNIDADSEPRH